LREQSFKKEKNMAQDNDITSTNGAPKEYWEARARKEKEEAETIAYTRRLQKVCLLWWHILVALVVIIFVSLCTSIYM
jgi:hypothetical protein